MAIRIKKMYGTAYIHKEKGIVIKEQDLRRDGVILFQCPIREAIALAFFGHLKSFSIKENTISLTMPYFGETVEKIGEVKVDKLVEVINNTIKYGVLNLDIKTDNICYLNGEYTVIDYGLCAFARVPEVTKDGTRRLKDIYGKHFITEDLINLSKIKEKMGEIIAEEKKIKNGHTHISTTSRKNFIGKIRLFTSLDNMIKRKTNNTVYYDTKFYNREKVIERIYDILSKENKLYMFCLAVRICDDLSLIDLEYVHNTYYVLSLCFLIYENYSDNNPEMEKGILHILTKLEFRVWYITPDFLLFLDEKEIDYGKIKRCFLRLESGYKEYNLFQEILNTE